MSFKLAHLTPHTLFLAFVYAIAGMVLGQESPNPKISERDQNQVAPEENLPADWARKYLVDDPLVQKERVSLKDLQEGIDSPQRRADIITKHFDRLVDVTPEEKFSFLENALQSEHFAVQQQAAKKLKELGQLETVLQKILLDYLKNEDTQLRRAAIVGLEHIDIPGESQTPEYWQALLSGLEDENPLVQRAAKDKLSLHGEASIPALLNALRSNPANSISIAEVLSDIVDQQSEIESQPLTETPTIKTSDLDDLFGNKSTGSPPFFPEMQATTAAPKPTVGKAKSSVTVKSEPRQVDPEHPTLVTVYYGTNRELIDRPRPGWLQILPYPFVALLLIAAAMTFIQAGPREPGKSRGCSSWAVPVLMFVGMIWALMTFRSELQQHWRVGTGPSYGPRRDAGEVVHYGTCEVSIPPRHQVGAVERPIIGPENEQEHVVLKLTEELKEDAFFNAIREKLADLPRSSKSCFVFIHGFNVDFENAARRTAQIHYDLKFEGVPIFFSWPSRANIRHYFSDRNEIEFSRYVIKQFLTDIAEKSNAERIHVIAHSMGADATCRAIAEMGEKGKVFDQIVLAAPDIDREVFRRQIAPRLTKTANRTTLYCSKNDLALLASRNFNDSPRAGDSSSGALVIQDVDTVDASEIDTDLLGHSYYGDCIPLLNDVHDLLRASLSPEERKLRPWPVDEGLQYWTLADLKKDSPDKKDNSPQSTPQ